MEKKLIQEIQRIKTLLTESDIAGIDELVYNPVTGPSGSIGHGYDRGKRVQGITWSNHDDHLHIGFTNRDVAMKVIDKAHEMGLKTTENPYAKRDPNGKVDRVHTKGSFHYRNFEGTPLVGMGVDISGNKNTVRDLIIWIEQNYSNKSLPSSAAAATQTTSTETLEPKTEVELTDFMKILDTEVNGKTIQDLANIESSDFETEKSFYDTFINFINSWKTSSK